MINPFIFAVLLVAGVSAQTTTCGFRQEWVACKNPCPRTCADVLSRLPIKACLPPEPCPGGCQCKAGFVLNGSDECVTPQDCSCGEYGYWSLAAPICPSTCTKPQSCAGKSPGCACKPGAVRQSLGGPCISRGDC